MTPMKFLFSLIVPAFALVSTFAAAASSKPNIVIILADDLGLGDVGCFNAESKIRTPHIDKLASEGMKFTDAHSPGPLCHPSRYGLITGRFPFRTDVSKWPTQPLIKAGEVTIASLLKSQGYRTAMVGKWHLGFEEKGYDKPLAGGPVDHGFDSFVGMRASTDIPPYFWIEGNKAVMEPTGRIAASATEGWSPIQGAFWREGDIAPDYVHKDVLPRLTDEAVKVLRSHQGQAKPLMLYFAITAPHTPWLPTAAFAGKSKAGMYGDFVEMVDAEVGRVLAALDEAGMTQETLVVFTSDNGPTWYPEDVVKFGHDAADGLRGMKADAWEGGHRLPFIVRWPGRVKAKSISDQTICFTDLMATFAEVCQTKLPDGAGPDSVSFLPVLEGRQPKHDPIRGPIVMQAGSAGAKMIRSGDWKLINQLGSGGFTKPSKIQPGPGDPVGQLYNLAEDRGEKTNLYAQHPEIVARLTAEMKKIVESKQSRPVVSAEVLAPYDGPVQKGVDTSTLTGKVMCGYQGWFTCPDDGMKLGWTHWARKSRDLFAPGNVTVDLWPDVSELTAEERFPTGFVLPDGKAAEVFSSANRETVLRHFQWMREYGIDGAFVQRFANGLERGPVLQQKNVVLTHAREGANRNGRAYAVMYDLSGLRAGGVAGVWADWRKLREEMHVTEDSAYLHHEGKPVVAVWGVGFNDDRAYTLAECRELIEQLKGDGCTVMLGVPTGWREGNRDAVPGPELCEVLALADILSPWTVGRYHTPKQAASHGEKVWAPDVQWCQQHGLDFLPVVYPGFSWHNLKGDALGAIPRLKGELLWSQVVAAKRAGCQMIYVAMFDEVDEGTAIFKCTNTPPVGEAVSFLDYEGLPSDYYLRLTGEAGRLLRGERTVEEAPHLR